MALQDLTPADSWQTPQYPPAGDGGRSADIKACLQDAADRTHYLKQRRELAVSGSVDDSVASLEAAFTGDTDWHDSTVVTKTVSGASGNVLNVLVTLTCVCSTGAGDYVDIRLKVVDNTVTSYLDGAAQRVAADATEFRVFLCGKHTMASASAVFTLQVKNSGAGISTTLYGGWNIMVL